MADSELSALTEDTAPAADDWFYKVNNAGTVDRKVASANMPIRTVMWGHLSGRYSQIGGRTSNNDTLSMGADFVSYSPVVIPAPITITALAVEVITPQTGAEAYIGLVSVDPDLTTMGSLVVNPASPLDCSTTGIKANTGLSVSVPAGVYLYCCQNKVTSTLFRGNDVGNVLWGLSTTQFSSIVYTSSASRTHAALADTLPSPSGPGESSQPGSRQIVFMQWTVD